MGILGVKKTWIGDGHDNIIAARTEEPARAKGEAKVRKRPSQNDDRVAFQNRRSLYMFHLCEVSVYESLFTLVILWRGTPPHLYEADSTPGPDRRRLPARPRGVFHNACVLVNCTFLPRKCVLNRCYMDGYQMFCCEQGKTFVDKCLMLRQESSTPALYKHNSVGLPVSRCSTEAGLLLLHWIHIQPAEVACMSIYPSVGLHWNTPLFRFFHFSLFTSRDSDGKRVDLVATTIQTTACVSTYK